MNYNCFVLFFPQSLTIFANDVRIRNFIEHVEMENFDTHLGPVLVSVNHAAHIYLKRGKKFIAQNKRQNEEIIFFLKKNDRMR